MGLFSSKPQRPRVTVLNVIDIDLSIFPDETFEVLPEEINEGGTKIFKSIGYFSEHELLNLFSTLTIITFENTTGKNYVFGCDFDDEFKISAMKKLVNEIAEIYGNDDTGLGKFTSQDTEDIENDMWSGRLWCDDKFPVPCSLSYYSEEDGASFTIWTV